MQYTSTLSEKINSRIIFENAESSVLSMNVSLILNAAHASLLTEITASINAFCGMILKAIKCGRKRTVMSPFKDDVSDDRIWYLVGHLCDLGEKREADKK